MPRPAGKLAAPIAALVALIAAGCGESPPLTPVGATVPTRGKITFKGAPLTQGTIRFAPSDAGRDGTATIQPDGTFVATTFQEGDGLLRGSYKVAVSGTGKAGKEVVAAKFRNPASSTVEIDIVDGKSDYPIDLN